MENFSKVLNKRIVKHFALDSSEIEKLIKWWQEVYPKDINVEPRSEFSVYVNKELGEISNETFYRLIAFKIFKNSIYWFDRFLWKTQLFLQDKPVEFLLKKYDELKNK